MTTDSSTRVIQPFCEVCGVDADVGIEHGRRWFCWDHWLMSEDGQRFARERVNEAGEEGDGDAVLG